MSIAPSANIWTSLGIGKHQSLCVVHGVCIGYAGILVAGEEVVGLHDILGPIISTLYEVILKLLHKIPVAFLFQRPK